MKSLSLKFITAISFIFLLNVSLQAQDDYKSAVGIRAGNSISASYKMFLSERLALEGIVGFNLGTIDAFSFSVLGQVHNELNLDGLQWYWGFGIGLTLFDSISALSILGNLGLDYKVPDVPFNISLDVLPTLLLGEVGDHFQLYGNLGLRYVIN